MLPALATRGARLVVEGGAGEEREARDSAPAITDGEQRQNGGHSARVEHGGFRHRFGALRGEAEFDLAAVIRGGGPSEMAELFQTGERGGECGGGDAEVAGECAGASGAVLVEVREQRGVVRREVVAIGFRAHMIDVAREVDLRVSALHSADEGRGHRGQNSGGRIFRQSEGFCAVVMLARVRDDVRSIDP